MVDRTRGGELDRQVDVRESRVRLAERFWNFQSKDRDVKRFASWVNFKRMGHEGKVESAKRRAASERGIYTVHKSFRA